MDEIELLERRHFEEWQAGFDPPGLMMGYALRRDDKLICLGGVWLWEGMFWATFASKGSPPHRVHRLAFKVIEAARQAGVQTIWAEEDTSIPNAPKWLERFGFQKVGETEDLKPVWRLDLGRSRDDELVGRRRNSDEGLRPGERGAGGRAGGEV